MKEGSLVISRRSREVLLAAVIFGGLGWLLAGPMYRGFVLDPAMKRAIVASDLAAVQRLARHGASVNVQKDKSLIHFDFEATTPLALAVNRGDAATVRDLLARGADVNRANYDDVTPLMLAAGFGNPGSTELLLQAGADVKHRDKKGRSPLIWLATPMWSFPGPERLQTAELLLKHGAETGVIIEGFTARALAEEHGLADLSRRLGRAGEASRNECLARMAKEGPIAAIRSHRMGAVKRRVSQGVSFRLRDTDGATALIVAAERDWSGGILRYILAHAPGIDRAAVNETGGLQAETPLIAACRMGLEDNVTALLAAGADPKLKDGEGNTALHYGSQGGDLPIVAALLRAGASVDARNHEGKLPEDFAQRNGHSKAIAVLKAAR